MTHDPGTDPLSALTLWSLALAREFGASIPQRVGHKHLKFLTKIWEKINKHTNFMKICVIFVPLCAGHHYGMDAPESEMVFIFQKVKPTWNQPDLSSVYMAARLLHLRNKLCQPAWWQMRSGWSHYKAWLAEDSRTGWRAAWCREELQSKRSQSCKRIIIKQMQSNWTTVWKLKKQKFV